MDNQSDLSATLVELDGLRISMGMSYQDVADACGVSKSTIYRTLNGSTEPTVQLVNAIAVAVQYKPPRADILPTELTTESYIEYLKKLILRNEEDHDRHVQQTHAHYNKLRRQARREKIVWMVLAIALMTTLVGLFLYDFTHLDRGWIQMHAAGLINAGIKDALLAVKQWIGGIL